MSCLQERGDNDNGRIHLSFETFPLKHQHCSLGIVSLQLPPPALGRSHPPEEPRGVITSPLSVLFQTLRSQSLPQCCFSHLSIISMTIFATTLLLNGLEPRALSKSNEKCSLSKAERLWQNGESAVPLPKEIQTVRRTQNQPENNKRDLSPSPKHHLPPQQELQTPSRAPVVGPAPNSCCGVSQISPLISPAVGFSHTQCSHHSPHPSS